jgi:hypothetical protein
MTKKIIKLEVPIHVLCVDVKNIAEHLPQDFLVENKMYIATELEIQSENIAVYKLLDCDYRFNTNRFLSYLNQRVN